MNVDFFQFLYSDRMKHLFKQLLVLSFIGMSSQVMALDLKINSYVFSGMRSPDGVHQSALVISMSPGWKTYWRHPGDSGLVPEFDFSGSENVRSIRFFWPRPEIETLDGITSLIFHDELVLPFEVMPENGADAVLNLTVQIGLCKNICIPWDIDISALLPAAGGELPTQFGLAMQKVIPVFDGPKNFAAKCKIKPNEGYIELDLSFAGGTLAGTPYTVIESQDPKHVIFDIASHAGVQHKITAKIADMDGKGLVFSRQDLQVTLLNNENALSFIGCD